MKSILDKVLELENKISQLPKGYISCKNINNKDYYYYQYKQKGKLISKYIKEDEALELQNNIKLRKQFEEELKKVKNSKEYKSLPKVEDTQFKAINVITGKKLKEFALSTQNLPKRTNLFNQLDSYIHSIYDGKICLIKGLAKTGKHTLIKHSILSLSKREFNRTAYITPFYGSYLSTIATDIETLEALGFRYIYINEITETDDFIDYAEIFATNFGNNMKIVITTQKSLSILFSTYDSLWKSSIVIDTSFISFKEYTQLKSKNSIRDYLNFGPLLSLDNPFKNIDEARNYTYYALARNLVYSIANLRRGRDLFSLADLYFNRHLYDATQFYIEYESKIFLSNIIKNAIFAEQDDNTKVLLNLLLGLITEKLNEKPEYGITSDQALLIEENLNLMDFLLDVPIHQEESKPKIKRFYNFFYLFPLTKIHIETILQKSLKLEISITAKDKTLIRHYIMSKVEDYLLRDVILMHLYFCYKDNNDISIEILDSLNYPLNILIKKKSTNEFTTLLVLNTEKEQEIYSCPFTNIQVLYLGPTFSNKQGIEYKNIEEYLLKLINED